MLRSDLCRNAILRYNSSHKTYLGENMDNAPICFDDWEHVLRTSVPADRRHAYREAIVKFRYWLRETGKLPDAEPLREHLEGKKSYLGPDRFEIRREALRWYY